MSYDGAGWDFDSDYLSQPEPDYTCRQCRSDLVDIGSGETIDLACPRCDEAIVAPRAAFWQSIPEHIEPSNRDEDDDLIPVADVASVPTVTVTDIPDDLEVA